MSIHHASVLYAPGPAFALVRPGLVVLVDASVGAAVAADLWAAVEAADASEASGASVAPGGRPDGRDLATLLGTVTEVLDPTWRALPSFAIVVRGAGAAATGSDDGGRTGQVSVQVAVRGDFSAAVTTRASADATEQVSGPEVTTWVDKTIDDVVEVELLTGAGGDASPVLAIVDGIVQVERVRWDVRDVAVAGAGTATGTLGGRAEDRAGSDSETVTEAVALSELAAEASQITVDAHADGSAAPGSAVDQTIDADADAPAAADVAPAADPGAVGVRSLVGAMSAHALSPAQQAEADFGRTLASFPEEWEEDAAEQRATDSLEVDEPRTRDDADDLHDADDFDDTTLFTAELVQIKNSISDRETSDRESSAPGLSPARPIGAIPPPPPPLPAHAVGQAPVVHQLGPQQAPPPVESFRDPAPQGTEILARSCFFGHANPPARMTCAQCGGGLSPNAQLVERPSLGRVDVSTGESVDLSVPIVVGRFPQAQTTGSPIAQRLVAVPSPSQDISRSHLEVRLDGWHVLLVDLDTVNGTMLLRAGQPPRRLHPLEPTLVADGDVVDLGDGVTLTFRELV